ncbi:hypothetical protein ACVWYQ_003103 [Bradyrhizobium sp. USDA 3397]
MGELNFIGADVAERLGGLRLIEFEALYLQDVLSRSSLNPPVAIEA